MTNDRYLAPLLLLLLILVSSLGRAAEPSWRAGVARTKITPEGSYWMGGYASRKRPSEGTLQDLHAKALAIDDLDGSRVVIVTTDLLVITRDLAEAVKRRVADKHKLPPSHLLLNCSHTHCSPEIRLYRESLHNIPTDLVRNMHAYVERLENQLVKLVGDAIANQMPARLSYAESQAAFAVNRRNNRAADVPRLRKAGKLVGPVDHSVPVLKVTDAAGRTMAILFGYACHNTIMSFYQTSGDYAGFAQRYIWVVGYSNDVFGYLPSLRVLNEGGYEGGGHMVYTKFPGPFTETVEQRVFEAIERLVQKVK